MPAPVAGITNGGTTETATDVRRTPSPHLLNILSSPPAVIKYGFVNLFRRLAKFLLGKVATSLSFENAVLVAKMLLEARASAAAVISSSGEKTAFNLIRGCAPVLFDVGGHIGNYTKAFLMAHPAGHSYVFEPSKSHFRILAERLGHCNNATLLNFGLGDKEGEVPLYKDADVTGLAFP